MTNPTAAAANAQTPLFLEPTPSAAPVDVDVDEDAVALPVVTPEEAGEVLEGLIVLIVVLDKDVTVPLLDVAVASEVATGDVAVAGAEVERLRDGF
jgi:hypothetical protein